MRNYEFVGYNTEIERLSLILEHNCARIPAARKLIFILDKCFMRENFEYFPKYFLK